VDWNQHKNDWAMAKTSQFILCKPHKWHVQIAGSGPLILMIHGAGGATQSWRHLFPLLAMKHQVVAIDLPGQGFTKLGAAERCGLREMTKDIALLCNAEGWRPKAIIGHSAGAAIALSLCQQPAFSGTKIIGINAALDTFKGVAGLMFPVMAKTLAMMPFVAETFAASAKRGPVVERLIAGTGSTLAPDDLTYYRALIQDAGHADATLKMMAQWDLTALISQLPNIPNDTFLLAGQRDLMVPPDVSKTAAAKLPNGQFQMLPDLGHLAHEEAPERVFAAISSQL
jgi:magnesium chelatase accessory protein